MPRGTSSRTTRHRQEREQRIQDAEVICGFFCMKTLCYQDLDVYLDYMDLLSILQTYFATLLLVLLYLHSCPFTHFPVRNIV